MSTNKPWKWVRRAVVACAALIAVVGLGSVLSVMVGAKFGDVALGMKTGSMSPTINPGDLVVIKQVNAAQIHPGDIITFRRPDHSNEIYTHRVAKVTYGQRGISFLTKGDANPVGDPWAVSYTGSAWKVAHVIRHGGSLLRFAQGSLARDLIAISIFVVSLVLLWPVVVDFRGESDRTGASAVVGVA